MNKKLIPLTACACSVFFACSSDSSSANNEESSTSYKREFITAVTTDNVMYAGTMSIDHPDDIGKGFIELGTRAGVHALSGAVIVCDLDNGNMDRYELNENNEIGEKTGSLSYPGVMANHIISISDTKAYIGSYSDSLFIINPKTMKQTGAIDLTKFKNDSAMAVSPQTGIIVDGRLYIGLGQNVSAYASSSKAQVAIIDVEKDSVIAVATDDRIAAVGSADDSQNHSFMISGDYIYVYSNASWGYAPGQKDGFLRIKIGETEFDKDYVWYISDEVAIKNVTAKGNYKYLAPFSLPDEDGNAYSFLTVAQDLAISLGSMDSFYSYVCKPVRFNPEKKTMEALPIGYTASWASYGIYLEDDGNVIFAVSTESDGNAYIRYNPSTDEAKVIATIDQVPAWLVPLQ